MKSPRRSQAVKKFEAPLNYFDGTIGKWLLGLEDSSDRSLDAANVSLHQFGSIRWHLGLDKTDLNVRILKKHISRCGTRRWHRSIDTWCRRSVRLIVVFLLNAHSVGVWICIE